jgi:hypothetical protein
MTLSTTTRWLLALGLTGCAHASERPASDSWACTTRGDTEACFAGLAACQQAQAAQGSTDCVRLDEAWCFRAAPAATGAAPTDGLLCQRTAGRCEAVRGQVAAEAPCRAHGAPSTEPPSPAAAPTAPAAPPTAPAKYACFTFQFAHVRQAECHRARRCEPEQSDRRTQPLVSDFTPCAPAERMWCFVHRASFASPPIERCTPDAEACAAARASQGLTQQPGTECIELK